MSLSLNGWSNAQCEIGIPSDRYYQVIALPMANLGSGLEEVTEFKEINVPLISLDIDNPDIDDSQTHLGYKLNWNFHYEDFISGGELYDKFLPLINARKNGWTLTLTPRIDEPLRRFRVNMVNETLTLMLRTGGATAEYHKGVLFTFRTKHMVQDLQWYLQPDAVPPSVTGRIQIWVTTS